MEESNLKIAIIIHSKTGNTLSVAEMIKTKLIAQGHQVSLERVVAQNDEEPEAGKVILTNCPQTAGYDAYVFGAPVRGFGLSSVMKAFLAKAEGIDGKPVFGFMTQHFPFRWMGGNSAIKQFIKALNNKSALIKGTSIINWSNKKRQNLIKQTVESIIF